MSIEIIKGNLFTSQCQTLVNTINCVGVMGAGVALEFRLRYPRMFERYVELCNQELIDVGKLWLYKAESKWILNFPTKKHWKNPSKEEYLKSGLQKFLDTYKEKAITSIAFPLLGANNGGIPQEESLEIMTSYLKLCNIPVEIYYYDPHASDDIYADFKSKFLSFNIQDLTEVTGLNKTSINKIKSILINPDINNIGNVLSVKGIGISSLQKALLILKKIKYSNPN